MELILFKLLLIIGFKKVSVKFVLTLKIPWEEGHPEDMVWWLILSWRFSTNLFGASYITRHNMRGLYALSALAL
jgi:hypothetical protein